MKILALIVFSGQYGERIVAHLRQHTPYSLAHPGNSRAGLICLHYPCLALMQPEHTETGVETLLHTPGKIFDAALVEVLATACQNPYRG